MKRQWDAFTRWLARIRPRWLPVALVALAMFAINAAARLISWKGGFAKDTEQMRIGYIAVAAVTVLVIGASAWWAVRHPLGRLVADLGGAALAAGLLAVLVGPFFGGSKPFAEGLAFFVGQILLFLGLAIVGMALGYAAVVAFGKDWKSRSLKRYEQNYRARPRRVVRG
jgi:hypothetical protein